MGRGILKTKKKTGHTRTHRLRHHELWYTTQGGSIGRWKFYTTDGVRNMPSIDCPTSLVVAKHISISDNYVSLQLLRTKLRLILLAQLQRVQKE